MFIICSYDGRLPSGVREWPMDAGEFIRTLDRWTAAGGPFPDVDEHDLTTVGEAEALCRAVACPHIYVPGEFGTLALFDLMGCFQASESREASFYLRDHGLPILRGILITALRGGKPDSSRSGSAEMLERRKALLFVVKVLSAYQQRGDAALIVQAARDPDLAEGYLWGTIFGMTAERHPEAAGVSPIRCRAARSLRPIFRQPIGARTGHCRTSLRLGSGACAAVRPSDGSRRRG